ncbi:hypothetical protein [Streptomyces lydicus]|uniref:hypothetical protein n=1 Tax=Streptomyces lydicus TaxID=47763 RepID=UPI0036F17CD9
MSLAEFFLALGATCRLTRFITKDTLAAGFRIWIAAHFGDDSKLSYLVNCSWCSSMWVAFAVASLGYCLDGSLWLQVPETALSLSYLAGISSRWLD